MESENRRKQIIDILTIDKRPASRELELSKKCQVSRQIIVGGGAYVPGEIYYFYTPWVSTDPCRTRGYTAYDCCMSRSGTDAAELEAIVDNGGRVHNVVVEHEVYGYLEGALNLRSRRDVDQYIHRMQAAHAELLSRISGGIHSHLIEADTEADMAAIEGALDKLGILYNP